MGSQCHIWRTRKCDFCQYIGISRIQEFHKFCIRIDVCVTERLISIFKHLQSTVRSAFQRQRRHIVYKMTSRFRCQGKTHAGCRISCIIHFFQSEIQFRIRDRPDTARKCSGCHRNRSVICHSNTHSCQVSVSCRCLYFRYHVMLSADQPPGQRRPFCRCTRVVNVNGI